MSNIITAQNLTKCFGELTAVDGINFEVHKAECFGFLGPNGAGKTSTMRMVYCASPVTQGELNVFGLSVKTHAREIKRRLGVVTQEDSLDPDLSVEENLMIFSRYFSVPKKVARENTKEVIEFLQLGEKRNQKIENLSGGLKRRLLVARGLINKPEVLILDEPTTGLDPQARHLIWHKLRTLKESGVTMLLTTHYMEEAENLCDRLVIMHAGKILTQGTPKELISRHAGRAVITFRLNYENKAFIYNLLKGNQYDAEEFHDNLYLFFKDEDEARNMIPKLGSLHFDIRRPTLEDVFLRLSGRELHD